jgi:hypothetical protein
MGHRGHGSGWLLPCAALWLIIAGGAPAYGAPDALADLRVSVAPDRIHVSARLRDALPPTVGEEIRNGIGKELYYYVVLKRRVPVWIDEEIASTTVRFSIRYNLVKQQFTVVHRQGQETVHHNTDEFDDVRRLISTIRDATIRPTVPLRRQDTYYVSVKAEMRSAKLPVYLEYFLFFLPVAQLTTSWTDTPVFHVNDAGSP